MQRLAMANLDWLVVRDFVVIESATWWKDGQEIETGELETAKIATEVFFLPAAAHTEKDGRFTNTQRMLQWHHKAVEPAGDARSDLWFIFHLGRRIRAKLAASDRRRDGPPHPRSDLGLPDVGEHEEPSADAVLAEINGCNADGKMLSAYTELRATARRRAAAGSTAARAPTASTRPRGARPASEQNWTGAEWGWAWPANRRILYNRASADPDGRPWSERKALVWWDEERQNWTGHDTPDFDADKPPAYRPADGAGRARCDRRRRPVHHAGRRRGLAVRAGRAGRRPAADPLRAAGLAVSATGSTASSATRRARSTARATTAITPAGTRPAPTCSRSSVTTYRLTEHFTAGGMSRWTPYLAELQPEMFCEVSPELAAERRLAHAAGRRSSPRAARSRRGCW